MNLELISSTLKMYKQCLFKSIGQLKNNWIIIFISIIAYFAMTFLTGLIASAGNIIAGFIVGLIFVAFLSFFYSWIYNISQNRKLKLEDLKEFDRELFSLLLNTGFIIWIVSDFLLEPIIKSLNNPYLGIAISLIASIIFNPLIETIVFRRYSSLNAFQHSLEFIKENWIEWFTPYVILMLPVVFVKNSLFVLQILSASSLLVPIQNIFSVWAYLLEIILPIGGFLSMLLALPVAFLFTIFRLNLYIELDTSSRRQRVFRAKNR